MVERYTLYPTTVEVLAVHDRDTECATACVPVPESEMLIGEFVALLVTVTVPDTVAADAGANATLSVAVCPAPIICPAITPDALNPVPVAPTVPIVTVELPLFVSVTVCELLLPTATLGNVRLDVLALSICVEATPVPDNGIARGELAALLTSDTDPETAPAVVGVNATLNVVLPPVATAVGSARPLTLNPVPDAVICEIFNVAVPVFWTRIVCELGAPTVTFPKLTLVGLTAIVGCPCAMPSPVKGTTMLGVDELFVTVRLPAMFPAAAGIILATKLDA